MTRFDELSQQWRGESCSLLVFPSQPAGATAEIVVYDSHSGDLHLISKMAYLTLEILRQGGLSGREILNRLLSQGIINSKDNNKEETARQLLDSLRNIGLIEATDL